MIHFMGNEKAKLKTCKSLKAAIEDTNIKISTVLMLWGHKCIKKEVETNTVQGSM